jgi:hypothetical protein
MIPFSIYTLAYDGSHAMNCTICMPYNGNLKDGGLYASWMKMWAKITWTKMKKSSKAEENPKIKESSPIQRAKMAQPWNKFLKFFMFFLLSMLFWSISMYLGMGSLTGNDFNSFVLSPVSVASSQNCTGLAMI